MPSSSKFPFEKFYENFHLFLSAFLVSLICIISALYYKSIPDFVHFESITFFTILLVSSIPFVILDPRIWYCIFMTTLSNLLFLKDFHIMSVITILVMLIGLIFRKSKDFIEDEEKMLNFV